MSTISRIASLTSSMKINWKFIVITVLSATILNSCSKEDTVETDVELMPYFELFASEASLRGFDVDYEAARIEGLIQDIPDNTVQGQCFHNERIPKKVIIDVDYWENADKLEKEFIIFHELGHCFLNRNHLDGAHPDGTCLSIMHSNPGVCNFIFNTDTREEYLDELFSI